MISFKLSYLSFKYEKHICYYDTKVIKFLSFCPQNLVLKHWKKLIKTQAAFRLYPIMHWTKLYIRFSRHFVKSFKVVPKRGRVTTMMTLFDLYLTQDFTVCRVFLNFMLFQITYRRRQGEKSSSLSHSQTPVKIGFISCMYFFRKGRNYRVSRDRQILINSWKWRRVTVFAFSFSTFSKHD